MKITIESDDKSIAEMTAEAAESGMTIEEVAWLHIRALRSSISNPDLPADFVKGILFALEEEKSEGFIIHPIPTPLSEDDEREN